MSDPSPLANVDWQIVAAGVATFFGTLWLTIKGMKSGKEKVEKGESAVTSIVGASIIENESIRQLTDQLKMNNQCLHDMTDELRRNTAAIVRQIDLDLMQSRKLDYRDTRDNPDS